MTNYYEQTRIDVATQVQAIVTAWTTYPLVVELDNDDAVDQATQTNPYLQVEIRDINGDQADLSHNPLVKQTGQIRLVVVVKQGSGTRRANELLDFIRPYFDLKEFTLVRCHAAEKFPQVKRNGQVFFPLVINYWYHRLSN